MLELFVLFWFAGSNGRKALSRGRSPGFFTGLTVGLWLGGEVLGFLVGYAVTEDALSAYGVALAVALVGAILSRIIAATCKPGDYRPYSNTPLAGAQEMGSPAAVTITREKSIVGAVVPYTFHLNGSDIGTLKNGEELKVQTPFRQNTLAATDTYGHTLPPLYFSVEDAAEARLVFRAGKFVDGAHQGITLLSSADIAALGEGKTPPPAASLAQSGITSIPIQEVPADPPNPLRCLFVLAAALLLVLATWFVHLPQSAAGLQYQWSQTGVLLRPVWSALLWGGGLYLMLQKDLKHKLLGGFALLLTAFALALCLSYSYETEGRSILTALTSFRFPLFLRDQAIQGLLVGATGALFGLRRQAVRSVAGPAWTAAGLTFAYSLYLNRFTLDQYGAFSPLGVNVWVNLLHSAVMLVLSVLFFRSLTHLHSKRLRISAGARIWCILVVCATTAAQILLITGAPSRIDLLSLLVTLSGVLGMLLLATNRRIGFLIAMLGIGTLAMGNLRNIGIMIRDVNFVNLGAGIGGLLNLLITWGCIYSAWNNRSTRTRTRDPNRPVHWVYKAASIPSILCGGFLLVMGAWSILFEVRRFSMPPFLYGVVMGAALLAIGILCLSQCLRKDHKPSRFWLVLGLIAGCLVLLTLVAACVVWILDTLRIRL